MEAQPEYKSLGIFMLLNLDYGDYFKFIRGVRTYRFLYFTRETSTVRYSDGIKKHTKKVDQNCKVQLMSIS